MSRLINHSNSKTFSFFLNLFIILGPPATVEVDIMVRSMGPISEVDMVIYYTI